MRARAVGGARSDSRSVPGPGGECGTAGKSPECPGSQPPTGSAGGGRGRGGRSGAAGSRSPRLRGHGSVGWPRRASGSVRPSAAAGGHGRPFPPSAQRLLRPQPGPHPGPSSSFPPEPPLQGCASPVLLVGQRRVLASAVACLMGLDGRRDGSSGVRQPEPKLTCSIHCSRRGKAARRGCLYVFLLPHAATRCS